MSKKYRLFSDVTSISRTNSYELQGAGLTNPDDTVISSARLAVKLRDRKVTEQQAKQLVLLELEQESPREDLIHRLISYLSYSGKEQTMKTLNKILNK